MKLVAWLILGSIVVLYGYFGDFFLKSPAESPRVLKAETEQRKVLKLVRAEALVKQALITEADVLYVAVEDDGSRRDEYASYLCGLIKNQTTSIKKVKVVAVKKARERANDVPLGESSCQ
jgi:hypothetical protein